MKIEGMPVRQYTPRHSGIDARCYLTDLAPHMGYELRLSFKWLDSYTLGTTASTNFMTEHGELV